MYNKVFESGKARELLVDEPRIYFYYVQLMSYRNKDNYLCCPSYETLMKDCHIGSKSTITKFNNKLKELGLLDWNKCKNGGKKKSNHYYFPQDNVPYYPPSQEIIDHYNQLYEEQMSAFTQ